MSNVSHSNMRRKAVPVVDASTTHYRVVVRWQSSIYAAPLRVKVRLVVLDKEASGAKKPVKDVRSSD
jgi:hypothetical protein